MISIDVRRYGVRHLFVLLLVASLCCALAIRNSTVAVMLSILIVIAVIGTFLALIFFGISDLIDQRPVNEKHLLSRLFNALGLASTVVTWLLAALMVVSILLYAGLMFVDSIAPP